MAATGGLCLRVRFHNATYAGADPLGGLEAAEWPPHPGRLYAALTSAYYARGAMPAEGKALDWLEARGESEAPAIHAPRAAAREDHKRYVSPSDMSQGLKDSSLRERPQPASVLTEPDVWFSWPRPAPEAEHEALGRLCAEVPYLGTSDSPVLVSVEDSAMAPEPTHVPEPGPGATLELRVPYKGMRAALDRAYGEGSGAPRRVRPTGFLGYRTQGGRTYAPNGFADVLISARMAGPILPLEATGELLARFRRALLGAAGDEAPGVLHGHDGDKRGHCALFSLPWTGEAGASGAIGGVGLALPAAHVREVSAAERAVIAVAFRAVRRLELGRGGPLVLGPASEAGERMQRLVAPERLSGPATRWRSVTPIVYDRHAKRPDELLEAARAMCRHAGVAEPVAVAELRGAPQGGVAPAHVFIAGARASGYQGQLAHLELSFAEPVGGGPLILGRGRFAGYGLFSPWRDQA